MENKEESVSEVVADHYNNKVIERDLGERARSKIFYLRNFNNWIKSILIGQFLKKLKEKKKDQIHVLDLGCGKGGDLLKWKKGEIKKLVCADIAETSLVQCEKRYQNMKEWTRQSKSELFDAEFIVANCTMERLKDRYKDKDTKFDLVSSQFVIHYSFESLPQAEMMLQNACECLSPGGYFIGTTPNAYELVRRIKESSTLQFGNEVYQVNFEDKDSFPLFGCKYDFQLEGVVDCPEFLVYFPLLEKMLEQYNMKLVYKKTFAEYFKEHCEEEEPKSLLSHMQALEPYPSDRDPPMSTADDAYDTAKRKIEELSADKDNSSYSSNSFKVGTISQSEWNAACLYIVFAFEKMEE